MRKTLLSLLLGAALIAGCGGDDADATATRPQEAPPVQLPEPRVTDLTQAAPAAGCMVRRHPAEGSEHTAEDVRYNTNPPTSGPHDPQWTPDGIHAEPPDLEQSVHALEHGRINIQYEPGLGEDRVRQLEALVQEEVKGQPGYHTLLFPNGTQMPYAVAATAWRHSLACERFSPAVFDALRAFRARYVDKGPELVP